MEGLLLPPALLEQPEQLSGRQIAERSVAGCHLREHMIEVVPAQSGDAVTGDHPMRVRVEFDQGSVEGAAAQVVDQQAANQLDAVAELDRSGGRLVEQPEHLETRPPEGVDGEEALVAVGVGGDAKHNLHGWRQRQRPPHVLDHRDQQVHERKTRTVHVHARLRPGVLEQTLERPHHGPPRFRLLRPRIPAVEALGAAEGDERREPVGRALRRLEREERIVAAVRRRHHDPRGPEVDAELHHAIASLARIVVRSPAVGDSSREEYIASSREARRSAATMPSERAFRLA